MIKIFSILFLAIGIFSDKRKRSTKAKTSKGVSFWCSSDFKGKCAWRSNISGVYGYCETNDCNGNGQPVVPNLMGPTGRP